MNDKIQITRVNIIEDILNKKPICKAYGTKCRNKNKTTSLIKKFNRRYGKNQERNNNYGI